MKRITTDKLLSLGMALHADKRTMEHRVRSIFARRRSAWFASLAAVVLCGAIGVLGFTTACQPAEKAKQQEKPIETLEVPYSFSDAAATPSPAPLEEPWLQDWGVHYRVDDDLLTPYGSEVWFGLREGYQTTVRTNSEYWLEKKTDGGWEKLEPLTEPTWEDADYTLPHNGMTTVMFVDWRTLYGALDSGVYRMGKRFESAENGGASRVGYAEFVIHYSTPSAADQAAAVERCYSAFEQLKAKDSIHFKSHHDWIEEVWIHNGNYLLIRDFGHGEETLPENNGRVDILARWDGVGYSEVRKNPTDRGSAVIGMELSTLDASKNGWDVSFMEIVPHFYGYSNKAVTFPEGIGMISDEMIRFVQTWPVVGMDYDEASAQLTYRFDDNGNLCSMEYKPLTDDMDFVYWVEVYCSSTEEIDAAIKPYTESLIVSDFSWAKATEKYTKDAFDIRTDGFVNNGGTYVTHPVEAAKLALKEYPNLGEYLSLAVSRDTTAAMWKVTIEAYVDYQATYCYRDVYLSDSGATQLTVYEGPVGWEESRK